MAPAFVDLAERAADVAERLSIMAQIDDAAAAEDLAARLWYIAVDLDWLIKAKASR